MAILFTRGSRSRLTSSLRASALVAAPHIPCFASLIHATAQLARGLAHATLNPSCLVEEETVRGYKVEHYYPVEAGEIFQHRYSVIGKLGYGSASTVWLCRDLSKEYRYVALKVYINCSRVQRELPVYNHINSLRSKYEGHNHIRRLLDSFEISGPHGNHTCLVHQALGMNLEELRELIPGGMFAADLMRQSLRDILRGLYFLQEDAGIIHTGIAYLLLRNH